MFINKCTVNAVNLISSDPQIIKARHGTLETYIW